jgi:hypothetical protein
MHSLIDEKMAGLIRTTGKTFEDLPDRARTMDSLNLPYDRPADNVIITGCQNLKLVPSVLQALARILERGGLSYTFLSQEYCCGNYLYRPAIKARDEEALTECRSLSKEFLKLNVEQAKKLGARRLILFCTPCYPVYKYAFPGENIVFYPQVISEVLGTPEWSRGIDYYAGCYKLHRNLAKVPMDLQSANSVFQKIQGLSVNRISAPSCCYSKEGLAHMIDHVKTNCMVHICTGCYFQAHSHMPADKQVKIVMLPEFIDMIQEKR